MKILKDADANVLGYDGAGQSVCVHIDKKKLFLPPGLSFVARLPSHRLIHAEQ